MQYGKKKNTIPSGFEDVLGSIYSNAEGTSEVTNIDDIITQDIPLEDDKDKEDEKEPPVNTEDGKNKTDGTQEPLAKEDDSDIPEDVLKNNQDNNPAAVE